MTGRRNEIKLHTGASVFLVTASWWFLIAGLACLAGCKDTMKWTEDVHLPDGRTVQLEREAEFEGPAGGPGAPRTESMQRIRFRDPDSQAEVAWQNGLDEGRVGVVALWKDQGGSMILTTPLYAGDERTLGCPNPPYLVYRYVAGQWRNVPLASLPDMLVRGNATLKPLVARERIAKSGGHLGVEQTRASVIYLGGVRPVPYVVHLGPGVVQTMAERNCDRELDYLIKEQ